MTATPLPSDGSGYLLYHSIGMYPGKGEAMAKAFTDFSGLWAALDDGQWMQALTLRARFIDLWRDLIAADPGTLTSAENVTTALYSVVGSLPEKHLKGKTLLVAGDCFPSLHFLLAGLAPRLGFTLKTVPLRAGESWVRDEDMMAAWDESVGVALLTFVTSTASHRSDVARLIAHGRKMGSLVGVDITQGAGLVPYSVKETDADFTVSTTLKWLCGTPGAGILHMKPELIAACSPELRGWFSQENIFSWDLDAFQYAGDARRFDHGTPSVLACAGSVPALEWHGRQDQTALLAQNRELGAMIIAEADKLGLDLVTPREDERRGGSLMVRLPENVDGAGLIDRLRKIGVFTDCRGPVMRLSPGIVTKPEGIEALFRHLRDAEGLGQ
ncbi:MULTISPECIES: aminotransferase class V-fold PLP-dependent enzyme [unclassified Nitratireductor]|uniref:aminotransferase class V-fold PLP-dependent enzyme n=1 Tax=unclassified Nitratireductor TaxID=2641084 RepID=UPI0025F45D27|nr:aminotransferase class V-fold PLP-dependent enzyme [Nitratireductor sp.]